jgi:hypothetical protein
MACSCDCNPCQCDPCVKPEICMDAPINPNHNCCTKCTGSTANNMFWQPGPPGYPGKCKLDLMTYGQLFAVLTRTPQARKDLLAITDDPTLVALANTTPVTESDWEDGARVMKRLGANSLPYYYVMRGNTGGDVGRSR